MNEAVFYIIFECFSVLVGAFIVYQYINSLFETKDGFYVARIAGYMIYAAIFVVLALFFNEPWALILYNISAIIVLEHLFYQSSFVGIISSTLFFAAIVMSSEILSSALIYAFGYIEYGSTASPGFLRVIAIIFAKLLQIVFVKAVGFFVNWKKGVKSGFKIIETLPLFLCQVFSVILIHLFVVLGSEIHSYFNYMTLFAIMGIMYINMVVFWYFDRIRAIYEYKHKNAAAEIKLGLQAQYYEMLEARQIETEAVEHDMQKHLNLIKELLKGHPDYILKEYAADLDAQINSIPKVIKTKNRIISALLTEKVNIADKNNIAVNLDIRLGGEIKIAPIDICIMLGNALDNAIEACQGLSHEKQIDLSIIQKESSIAMIIENKYNPGIEKRNRMGKQGYGLKNIKKVAEKYNGTVICEDKDEKFTLTIVIP